MVWLAWLIMIAVFIVLITILQVENSRQYDDPLNRSVKYAQHSIDEILRLQQEVERLKRGDFTEEEIESIRSYNSPLSVACRKWTNDNLGASNEQVQER